MANNNFNLPRYGVKRLQGINWVGTYTLFAKEVNRFFKVGVQTIMAPVASATLLMVVFVGAIGLRDPYIFGDKIVNFTVFILPGLSMMSIINNSFQNTSSSMVIGKLQGSINDVLVAPLSVMEFIFAFMGGGIVRGILVGSVTGITIFAFIFLSEDVHIYHLWAVIFYGFNAAIMFSLFGMVSGIWAKKIDQMSVVTNFIVAPLAMISGTFFPIQRLPEYLQTVALFNPVYQIMDGFRYGFIDHNEVALPISFMVCLVINITLFISVYKILKSGWRLKA